MEVLDFTYKVRQQRLSARFPCKRPAFVYSLLPFSKNPEPPRKALNLSPKPVPKIIDVGVNTRVGSVGHAGYRKLFRVDGQIDDVDWGRIVAHFFRSNDLVIEYFGELLDERPGAPAIDKPPSFTVPAIVS